MTKLVYGPFTILPGEPGENEFLISVPLKTQGDWRGTEEGQQELEQVCRAITLAIESKLLPNAEHTIFTPDDTTVIAGFRTKQEAEIFKTQFTQFLSTTGYKIPMNKGSGLIL